MKKTESARLCDYRYICDNRSVAQPFYNAYATWFHNQLFKGINANTLTVTGFICVLTGLVFARGLDNTGIISVRALAGFICIHLFTLLNLTAGIRSKRTGSCAPLEDFIRHYLNGVSIPLIILTGYAFMPRLLPAISVLGLIGGMVALVGFFYVRYHLGILMFGKIGYIESGIVMQLYLLGNLFSPISSIWQMPIYGDITLNTVFVTVAGMFMIIWGIVYLAKSVKHSKTDAHLTVFLIMYGYLSIVMSDGDLSPVYLAGIIVPPVIYVGELLEGYLTVNPLRKPLAIASLVVVYVRFFLSSFEGNAENIGIYSHLAVAVLIGLMITGFVRSVLKLRKIALIDKTN